MQCLSCLVPWLFIELFLNISEQCSISGSLCFGAVLKWGSSLQRQEKLQNMSCNGFPLVRPGLILPFEGLWEDQTILSELTSAGKVKEFIVIFLRFQSCYCKKGYLEPCCCTGSWNWNSFSFCHQGNWELQSRLVLGINQWDRLREHGSEFK